jgi:hypothetical protein
MRVFRLALVLLLISFCALQLSASVSTPSGPQISINAPNGSCAPVGLTFLFNADSGGGGSLCFTNNSPETYWNMEIFVESSFQGALTCDGNQWVNCSVNEFGGFPTVVFWGGKIPQGASFDIDMSGFSANGLFRGNANETAIPEPTTIALIGSGLGALVSWRRRK